MKAVTLLSLIGIFTATARAAEPTPVPLAVLTTAQQVIDLGVEGARSSPNPVRVRGVVTYVASGKNWGFVQDHTAGLLVVFTSPIATPIFGQQVEVSGTASAGQFTTECVKAEVRVLGPAPMPAARHSRPERLLAGDDCGRWVELEGRVRDVSMQAGEMTVLITSERYHFNTTVALPDPLPLPRDWLDAKVRLSGVCWTVTDRENQPAGFRIFCSSSDQLTILELGRADVFATPLISPAELRQRKTNSDERIRVAGTVLMHSPGRRLYLQDELGPVRTRLLLPFLRGNTAVTFVDRPHPVPLAPGDRVEVIASPATTAYTPLLGDAEYRKIGSGPVPVPVHRSMKQLTSGHHSGELVTLRARFLDRTSQRDGGGTYHELTLEAEGTIFHAWLSTLETFSSDPLTPNSMVQITGICSAGGGEWDRVRVMRVLLRTSADVRVLGPVPFWMLWPVGRILGGATVLGGGALGWIWLLRRRVAQRTAALAASEAHTRRIIDTALDAVVTMDAEGKVCGWSAQAEKIFGWSVAEAMGRMVAELIIPERYREAHARGLAHMLATGEGTVVNRRIEISALRKDGREFPVELSIVAMRTNGAWNFSAFVRDLSERQQAESAIAEGEARMKTVLDHAPEAIMAFDADTGRFIEANENTARLFGVARAELLKLSPGDVSPLLQPDGRASADMAREKVSEALAGGVPVFEWTHRNAQGIDILCEVRLTRLPAAGRNLCIGTVTDISERKRAEADLHKALAQEKELGQLKSNFVNLVSHEFRTPLGIIMSATENLENYLERLQPEERAELLADIRTSTQRMSGLMQEVLLLARVDAGKLACKAAPLDLRVFLGRLIEEVRSASDHACVIDLNIAPAAIPASADEALLRHTFTNLLSNAVKYSPLGQPVHFRVERDGPTAVFTVQDEGIGIPDGDQKQLFQTFHRGGNVGERPGTGLGLVIVKRCVELHGGTLHLESKVNAGTTVTVSCRSLHLTPDS